MIRKLSFSPQKTFYTKKLYSYQKQATARLSKPKFKTNKVTKCDIMLTSGSKY